ncbi:DUF1684 domain-containing protein [Psychroflexus aestuariivivens]|uniref:DUF1684 domain-containing protein n=1 Tax=Psychroflexus aestuariivivens TaxID=1795040 RepID=UPI000FD9DC19|nr:DUF1684 domain-containing protein [Psychroflexus aestuariivivens]
MKIIISLFILFQILSTEAQTHKDSIIEFQNHLTQEYKNPDKSPLSKKEIKKFEGHDFFPIDENFKVKAEFEKIQNPTPFLMKTSSERLPTYEVFGIAIFEINNQKFQLNIYQSHRLREIEEYKNDLFLPFTDLTNGDQTYSGGRYIDLEIPDGNSIVIDFNKAYNPYCAYSHNYSCPKPPAENDLDIEIKAGIKL